MRHKTTILGSITLLVILGAAVSLGQTATAYSIEMNTVHLDYYDWESIDITYGRNIMIETAEGTFITATKTALDRVDDAYRNELASNGFGTLKEPRLHMSYTYTYTDSTGTESTQEHRFKLDRENAWEKPRTTIDSYAIRINDVKVIEVDRCGNKKIEEERLSRIKTNVQKLLEDESKDQRDNFRLEPDARQKFDKRVCGYAYSNTIKDEYTYTITDLPKDREIPPDYNSIVRAGVEAGLDRWGDINDIEFRHTDSRLEADILIQQQIGNGRQYGNAELGCIFDHKQCTIQLHTDINVNKRQTLTNKQSIEWTIAHEFGHLIGLPHHIEPDNIMNTIQEDDVRTYYEARNINVPDMKEPTYEQRLLGYEDNETYTTDSSISEITKHEKFTEFIEYITQVMRNTPQDDRLGLWWTITDEIFDRIRSVVFP